MEQITFIDTFEDNWFSFIQRVYPEGFFNYVQDNAIPHTGGLFGQYDRALIEITC